MKSGSRLRRLRAEVGEIIDAMLAEEGDSSIGWNPKADLIDFEDRYEVRLEVPGVDASDLRIEIRDRMLRISGDKRRSSEEPTALRYHLMERFVGPFEAGLDIPGAFLPHSSTAQLDNGILTIRLIKVVDQRHRCYVIDVEEEPSRP